MTMRSRWIVLPLAALAAILILAAILFNWNWFKGPIETAASAALGRNVEIAGDLDVDLSMAPTITLEQVRIANAQWGSRPNMLTIPQLAFALDLGQLLRGAVVLPFLRVHAQDLLIETNQQGDVNWQLGPPDQKPGAPPLPIIEDLQIANAAIRYHQPGRPQDLVAALDDVKGAITSSGVQVNASGTLDEQPLSLHLASAPVGQLEAEAKRFPFELDAKLGSTRLTATGSAEAPLQGQGLSVEIALDSQEPGTLLALAGREARALGELHLALSVTSQDQIWTVQPIDLRLGQSDLRGHVTVQVGKPEPLIAAELASDQIRLEDLGAFLTENAAGQPSGPGPEVAIDTAIAQAKAALADHEQGADGGGGFRLPVDMLPSVDGVVSYTVGRMIGPELALTNLDLHARFDDGLPHLALAGGGEYQNAPVTLDVQLGGAKQAYPVRARIEAAGSKIQVDGEIGRPETLEGLDLQVQVASQDVSDLLALADVSVPAIPPFLITGHVIQDGQVWHVADLYAQFSESELAGDVTVDLSQQRPFITADLQSKRLLVSDLMTTGEKPAVVEVDEAAAAAGGEEKDIEQPALISIEGVNFDELPKIDADVSFTGEFVEVQELRFEPPRFDLELRDQIAVLDASADGQFRNGPLTFEAHAGTKQNLENPDAPYPIELQINSKKTQVTVQGTSAKPGRLAGLQVDVAMRGPNLDRLGEVLQISMPTTPPFDLQSHLTHDQNRWNLTGLNGTIGDSDIHGQATIALGGARPTLQAELTSNRLDFDDLGLLVGAPGDTSETLSAEQERAAGEEAAQQSVLPDEPFDVPELHAMDARVSYRAKQVLAKKLPLEGMVLDLTLEDGQLTFQPLRFDLADGKLESTIRLDGRTDTLAGDLELDVRNIRMNQLLSRFNLDIADIEMEKAGVGTFSGHAQLAVRGKSIKQLAGSADGQILLIMRGGRINALIVEGLGLDVGEALALILTGDEEKQSEMVPIQCFVSRFDVADGVMQAKALVLETSDSTITGAGKVDLGKETLSLQVVAHPKDASILTASTPIRIEGTFKHPKIDVISKELEEKSLAALALGVVMPIVGAIIPFFEPGETEDTNCASLIKAASGAAQGESPSPKSQ
jgi:uncharacterized protein involved in outer membrane biogenesis